MTDSIVVPLIGLIIIGLTGITLPYFCYLFWRLRSHFLISARYPKWTLAISCMLWILGTSSGIALFTLYLYDYDPHATRSEEEFYGFMMIISQISAFCLCASVVYRAFLLYVKWDNQELTLKAQSSIIHKVFNSAANTSSTDTMYQQLNERNPHKTMKYCIISTIVIGFIFVCVTAPSLLDPTSMETQRMLFPVPFLMVIVLGIVVLIKSRKVKESVLAKRETYIISMLILVNVLWEGVPLFVGFRILISLALSM